MIHTKKGLFQPMLQKRFLGISAVTTAILSLTMRMSMADGGLGEDKSIGFAQLLREMGEREALATSSAIDWKNLQASALNTDARHNAGFFGAKQIGHFVRIEDKGNGQKEWVLMEHQGPGVIVRMWSPNMAKDATLRIYLDGDSQPTVQVNMMKFFYGEDFVKPPFAALEARGGNVYLPIPFAKSCRITVDKNECGWAPPPDLFYDIQYRTYPSGTEIKSFSLAEYDRNQALLAEVGRELTNEDSIQGAEGEVLNKDIPPGGSEGMDLKPGTAAVKYLAIQFKAADMPGALRSTEIKMSFDGINTVSCPIGDFFGTGYGLNPFNDWMRSVSKDGTMTCRWVMPYKESAQLTVKNIWTNTVSVKVAVGYEPWDWNNRSMHFHAGWKMSPGISNLPVTNFNFVKIAGKGIYVGDTLSIKNNSPKWWGEGPEKVTVDHEAFPSEFGTGSEDYYGYAWGDRTLFNAPFISQPRLPEGPDFLGTTVNTRIRSLDVIPYQTSLDLDLEVLTQGAMVKEPTTLDYSVAAYWYGFETTREMSGAAHSNRNPL